MSFLKKQLLRGRPLKSALICITLQILLALLPSHLRAQTLLNPNVLTGTPAAGEYYHPVSITVSPTFSFTAGPGASLRLFIGAGPDCQSFAGTQLSGNQNYIVTYVPRDANVTNPADPNLSSCQVIQTVQYFDGLGRPLQTVQVKGSTNGYDVVVPVEYDAFGREIKKYLPYSVSSTVPGTYRPNATSEQSGFYNAGGQGYKTTSFPFSQTVLEASPLNRPLEQGAPGNDWQPAGTPGTSSSAGHTVKTDYGTNAGEVKLWQVNGGVSGSGAYCNNAVYAAGQLYKTTLTDENGRNTIEYKDKQGQVVCKMAQKDDSGNYLSTYYVYDDFENLAYVIPPISMPQSFSENDAVFNQYIYAYHYDGRNRLIEKKLPGKGWEYMVYNTLDQVVMTQNGEQRNKSPQQWTFTKYDGLGRVVMTGIWTYNNSQGITSYNNSERTWLENYYATTTEPKWETRDNGTSTGYNNQSTPGGTNYNFFTINYYDNYSFPGNPYGAPSGVSTSTTGLLTASKTTVLNTDGTYGPALWSVIYYDDRGRSAATYAQHYMNGTQSAGNYDLVTSTYNFNDQVTATNRQHFTTASSSPTVTIANRYEYDHMGRKKDSYEQISGSPEVLLARNEYNETGQLLTKRLHSTNSGQSFLQDTRYSYNERGWMTNSSAGLFKMQLNYNENIPSGLAANWNGNISEQYWGNASLDKHFDYRYDALNRLTSGNSTTGNNETDIRYDDLGNIQHLARSGVANTGDFTYRYAGNQLQSVDNLTGQYSYDQNGNMSHDGRTGTDIQYNYLNLPRSVPGKNLSYVYDAIGQKLSKVSAVRTDYVSGIQYENGNLQFIQTEEGRAIKSGAGWNYEYTLADHLGNSRVSFDQTSASIARQSDDYYPFGLRITGPVVSSPENKYLYNKKELQDETGQYDYGARFYDPAVGRFGTLDRFAEKFMGNSPYQYGANNPILNIDMNGDSVIVGSSITSNKVLNKAFNDFAGTKAGRRFLANYAAKSQTVGGYTFKANGRYNNNGIDLSYDAKNLHDNTIGGVTNQSIAKNGRAEIDVTINTQTREGITSSSDDIFDKSSAFIHESFLHVNMNTQDFLNNGKFDNNNIDPLIRNNPLIEQKHWQHIQVLQDYSRRGYYPGSMWPLEGIRALQGVNQNNNNGRTPGQILQKIWDYSGGLNIDSNGRVQ